MGKAAEEHLYTDDYGRKWQVRSWYAGFSDQKLVFYALPTPDGYVAMLSLTDTSVADMMEIDMKILVDYLYLTYYGTLTEWNNFLKHEELLPSVFKQIHFQTDYKNYVKYQDNHFKFKVGPENMHITKDSDFQLRLSYYKEGGKVIWGPASIAVGESKLTSDYVSVNLGFKPPAALGEQYRRRWDSMVAGRNPYDGKTYINDTMTGIAKVVSKDNKPLGECDILYSISWHEQGSVKPEAMEKKLEGMAGNLEPTQ
jgi:serine protease Do